MKMQAGRIFWGISVVLTVLILAGRVQASLVTIGTATYNGNDYNLIYDDDAPMGPIVWLDYSHLDTDNTWSAKRAWAAGLNDENVLTYNLDPAWEATHVLTWMGDWRLPKTVAAPPVYGCDGSTTAGYNITSSEMGHLFYSELGNLGYKDTGCNPRSSYGLENTGDFHHLVGSYTDSSWYWSDTEMRYETDPDRYAWIFNMHEGLQGYGTKTYENGKLALAVRPVDVSPVPLPGALWLLGSGLCGLLVARRRQTS